MWAELGKTVRKAMDSWGHTLRLCVCACVLGSIAVAILIVTAL